MHLFTNKKGWGIVAGIRMDLEEWGRHGQAPTMSQSVSGRLWASQRFGLKNYFVRNPVVLFQELLFVLLASFLQHLDFLNF